MHDLLVYLLRENPENRPQDPVALEKQMRDCLTKIEKRQAIGRKLGIPLAAVIPRKAKQPKAPASPFAQVLRGVAAVAVLLLAAGAAAEYFFPDKIPFLHRDGKIGVPVGVPDASKFATIPNQAAKAGMVAANQPPPIAAPTVAATNESSPPVAQQNQTQNTPAPATSPAVANTEIASAVQQSEPPAPGLGPRESPSASTSAPENSDQSSSSESNETTVRSKKTIASNRRSTLLRQGSGGQASDNARRRALPGENNCDRGQNYHGRHHAQVVGRTSGGRFIVRLSSG